MRLILAPVFAVLLLVSPLRAAQTPDPVLLEGLQTWVTNGVEAGLRVLFSDRLELVTEMKDGLLSATRRLGSAIDTEIVAIQPVSKRITRYYVAIYYYHRPLWLRIERYSNGEKAFYLPLRYSFNPDEILPGYITEFQVP